MSVSRVVIVLSAGRCGTQWLAATLKDLYPRDAAVQHEPLGPLYRPRRYFRRWDEPEAILEVPEVRDHVARIAAAGGTYVETGWPVFAALPLLAQRFGERLRVVHLTRHPVPTALSHLAHNSYAGSPRADAYTEMATLGAGDPSVFQRGYEERWEGLTPYEKCLFWWTEVSMFGLEAEERLPDEGFLRVRSEEMLAGERQALRSLLEHAGLRWDERVAQRTREPVDRWHHHTDEDVDPLAIRRHPAAMRTAKRLGYDIEGLDVAALEERYRGEPDPGLDRIGRFAG